MRNPLRNLVARQVDRPTLRERFDATCERWRRRPTAQVSPELAQAIADAERLNAAIKEPDGFEGDWWPDRGLVRQGVEARAAVVRFPSVGMADTAAKLASVGRIYGAPGIREEVQSSLSNGDATYDDLALTVVAELLEKGGLGAAPIVPLSARPDPIFGLIEEARHLTREHGRLNAISADLPDSHPS